MDNKSVMDAVEVAQRFLMLAAEVLDEQKTSKFTYFGTKKTGALRRSSLDLTRALAEMRKA